MKVQLTTAALILAAVPALAQSSLSGVSNPDPVVITSDDNAATPTLTPRTPAKPAAGRPAAVPSEEVYGTYVPYKGPAVVGAVTQPAIASDTLPKGDVDGMIVTSVPERDGEVNAGTLLKTRIREDLSTATTLPGARFTAEVMEPIEKDGRVIIPIGSILEGQVTSVHGGRRITGTASLHLETRDVTLPDGTHYVVHAQLIDTSKSPFKVSDEGTLKRKDHTKENVAVFSLVTGSGAVAGALIGGGVGAAVGAGVGAGISTVMWLKQDRQATLSKDVRLVFCLTSPMILTPMANGSVSSLTNGNGAAVGAAQ